MVTVSQITQKLIKDNLLYQETILIGITNYTSLAKLLKPDVEKIYRNKVKLSTITRAIQRYAETYHEKQNLTKAFFFKAIKLDSNVIYIVVNETAKAMDKIRRAYDEVDFNNGHIFNILHGNHQIVIITNKEYKEMILDLLIDENISHIVEDHHSISLTYSKDYTLTPGVIYWISRCLAWQKINVLTWLDTPHELTLIVHDNDATKCYDILERMQKKQKDDSLKLSRIKEPIIR